MNATIRGTAVAAVALASVGCTIVRQRDVGSPVRCGTMVQALAGAAFYGSGLGFRRRSTSNPAVSTTADVSTMPVIGVAGQRPFGRGDTHLGFDAGMLFGSWHDASEIRAAGGGVLVESDASLSLFDVFAGVYGSARVADRVRVYLAGGPLLMFADIDVDNEVSRAHDSSFGVGGYLRGGAEYRMDDGAFLGLGARALATELDFDAGIGDVDLSGVQVMLTYTRMF